MDASLTKMYEDVKDLLASHAINPYARYVLASHVAYVSLEMHHLYEDLGFANRVQMGEFMMQYFPTLACQKPKEKLWKKFLYDSIGAVAPACHDCDSMANCFRCIVDEEKKTA